MFRSVTEKNQHGGKGDIAQISILDLYKFGLHREIIKDQ